MTITCLSPTIVGDVQYLALITLLRFAHLVCILTSDNICCSSGMQAHFHAVSDVSGRSTYCSEFTFYSCIKMQILYLEVACGSMMKRFVSGQWNRFHVLLIKYVLIKFRYAHTCPLSQMGLDKNNNNITKNNKRTNVDAKFNGIECV